MKTVREADLERAFTTMMNKLIFGKKIVLDSLLDTLRGDIQKESLRKIEQIDRKLELNAERKKTLTTLMTRGYLEPAIFTQENNEIAAEADALMAEKDQLVKTVSGSMHQADSLNDLIRYAAHAQPSTEFNSDLVTRFLDHVTIRTREEIVFHLKCGLNFTERIGER